MNNKNKDIYITKVRETCVWHSVGVLYIQPAWRNLAYSLENNLVQTFLAYQSELAKLNGVLF